MCDATGIVQFLSAVGELARGLSSPTVSPAWSRELLEACSPPEPTFPHHEYDPVPLPRPPPPQGEMVTRTFTFTAADVAALKEKRRLPPHLHDTATTFDRPPELNGQRLDEARPQEQYPMEPEMA
ncbi:hypothetical protein HU200_046388 [Digitaria exilis]|uniref:Uncharacterized protein n=1 Tax=Digitaria exilis TaxID=1010633 RepID=A0A835EEV3_9POAL|nr:hypothetical protein HU200_046388 [Digitaria exilis]